VAFRRFQLDQQSPLNQQIDSKPFVKHDPFISDWYHLLPFDDQASRSEALKEASLINRLKQPGAERFVQLESAIDGNPRQFFQVTRQRRSLFVASCLCAIQKRSLDPRLLLHLPGLPLAQQFLQVRLLALARLLVLRDHCAVEGWGGIVIEHAERHRERAERHFDQHMRQTAIGLVVHRNVRALPIAIDDVDDLEHQAVSIHRQALSTAGEQQRLTMFDPQLVARRVRLFGERGEHIVIIDDAILEDLDERRALVRIGRLEHRRCSGDLE